MTRLLRIDVPPSTLPVLLALSMLVVGASCDKKSSANSKSSAAVVTAIDNTQPKGPVDKTPIPGVDTSKLSPSKVDRFYKLAGLLASPCGKSHSLRKSLTEDSSCRRAQFAVNYVIQMLDDEVEDEEIDEFYALRYVKNSVQREFKLDETMPHLGPADAPVKLVEFYDYGCPACKQFAPLLEEAIADFPTHAVLYYKQFPLPSHTHSKSAAQAALAAGRQGKFHEMHMMLFANQPKHEQEDLDKYASALGLNMGEFAKDFEAALPAVESDVTEGDTAEVHGTPTLFINGRQYEGLAHPRYIRMWIEEELALNR